MLYYFNFNGFETNFRIIFEDFEKGLGASRTDFGLAIGIQLLFGGIFAPIFGLIADKLGGNNAVFIGFMIFGLGVYMLYAGPNTGIFFQISLGILIGIALGATAIGVPVSEVGKHFPNQNRTVATGIVTAAASIGYFLSPLFTKYSLGLVGWEQTLKYFMYFIGLGLFASIFLFPSKTILHSTQADRDQSFSSAIKEAFSHKGYVLLVLGFFVCGFQITLVGTHIPGYMQDRGMGGWSATIILALIGFFNIFGTLGMGFLGINIKRKSIMYTLLFKSYKYWYIYFFSTVYHKFNFFVLHFAHYGFLQFHPQRNSRSNFGTKYLSTLFVRFFMSSIRSICWPF